MHNPNDLTIRRAETPDDIARCYPVMRQLRPHLSEQAFLARVQKQINEGYRLAFAERAGTVEGVAGYRVSTCLAWGRFLYIDDLVADEGHRSIGVGKAMLDWLTAEAVNSGCDELHLDSGMQRLDAHRFYDREAMQRLGYHFAMKLKT